MGYFSFYFHIDNVFASYERERELDWPMRVRKHIHVRELTDSIVREKVSKVDFTKRESSEKVENEPQKGEVSSREGPPSLRRKKIEHAAKKEKRRREKKYLPPGWIEHPTSTFQ